MAEFIWEEEGPSNNNSFIAMHLYLSMIIWLLLSEAYSFHFCRERAFTFAKIEPFFYIIIIKKQISKISNTKVTWLFSFHLNELSNTISLVYHNKTKKNFSR